MVREQIREDQSDAREGQQAVFQERTIQSLENFLKEKGDALDYASPSVLAGYSRRRAGNSSH